MTSEMSSDAEVCQIALGSYVTCFTVEIYRGVQGSLGDARPGFPPGIFPWQAGPRMVWVLDGDPRNRTSPFAGLDQRERNLRHKAIGGS